MISSPFLNNYGALLSKCSLSDFKIHSYQCTFCVMILSKHNSAALPWEMMSARIILQADILNFPFLCYSWEKIRLLIMKKQWFSTLNFSQLFLFYDVQDIGTKRTTEAYILCTVLWRQSWSNPILDLVQMPEKWGVSEICLIPNCNLDYIFIHTPYIKNYREVNHSGPLVETDIKGV